MMELARKVKEKEVYLSTLDDNVIKKVLLDLADVIVLEKDSILSANKIDVDNAILKGVKSGLIDRLKLNEDRIKSMAESLRKVVLLENPVGKVLGGRKLYNNLQLYKTCVPLGVVGVIYESRPNVTLDVFSLCFKTHNCVILKGGSDAINSNKEIVRIIKKVLKENSVCENVIELIEDTSREAALKMMKLNKYIDVLIPRGGKNLIETVVLNSTIPVIETGTGNCHIYVDKDANLEMALKIIENAKTQRVGVCNACESLVLHKDIIKEFIPKLVVMLKSHNVEMRGDKEVCKCSKEIIEATEEDFKTEYLDYIISIKTVNSIDEAIKHINSNNTKHSEAIVTNSYDASLKFTREVDASSVYVNASTRFTDGEEFGLGAEIGISTQKLHARGPMGLDALTTYKYLIFGEGQVR